MARSQHYDSDLTVEELLELAKSKPTIDETQKVNEVDEFILVNKVRPSETELAEHLTVYWAYKKWCKANKIKQRSRFMFHREFGRRFNSKKMSNGDKGYAVVKKQFELTQDEWFMMRKNFRNEKAKNAKKRRKVPRPES